MSAAFLHRFSVQRSLCQSCHRCLQRRTLFAAQQGIVSKGSNTDSYSTDAFTSLPLQNENLEPRTTQSQSRINLLEQTKIQEFLNSVAASKEVTIEDIERHKPSKHAPSGTTQYESDYNDILDTLLRSFTVKQLKNAHKLYNLTLPKSRTKRDYTSSIIERQWRWPSLSESQKKRKDRTEIVSPTFPLTTREAFLLLGKDGANLHLLSSKYNVRVSFKFSPLSITVEGIRESVEKMARYLNTFKQGIVEVMLELPTEKEILPKLLQRVSRLSGALAEPKDNNRVHISYRKNEARASFVAKALSIQGIHDLERPPLIAYTNSESHSTSQVTPGSPRSFSMYPFAPIHPLPWNLPSGRTLRIRDIGGLLDPHMESPDMLEHKMIYDMNGNTENIREFVMRNLVGSVDAPSRICTLQASLGHLLFCQSEKFTPYTLERFSLTDALRKAGDRNHKRVFIPCLPSHLSDKIPSQQRLIHRIIYRSVAANGSHHAPTSMALRLEISQAVSDIFSHQVLSPDENESNMVEPRETVCRVGTQKLVDLIMPDRMMDIRFSIFDDTEVSKEQWPRELCSYEESISELSSSNLDILRADLPLILSHNGVTYALQSSTLIRQSIDTVPGPGDSSLGGPRITSESVLDLNSNQRYMECQVACDDPGSDASWEQFLYECDWMTKRSQAFSPFTSSNRTE
ncbi:hypothetical protein AMATHDRAFT_131 [Amanita thiersii Skay4041]|uniref:K Homology domain-containing protein n=1 Tax=Amanita thiersii Skay4041 TaxID=703135 RepID=A0A2A9P1N1_9AGAR|nr:hypothetical protein AMATHDRAFT_131 [Amanita thiersii Skay4041]